MQEAVISTLCSAEAALVGRHMAHMADVRRAIRPRGAVIDLEKNNGHTDAVDGGLAVYQPYR